MTSFQVPPTTSAELQATMMDAEFKLRDAQNIEHHYTVKCHNTTQGQPIVFALMAHMSTPVLRLIGSALRSESSIDDVMDAVQAAMDSEDGDDDEADEVADATISSVLDGIDLAALGNDLRDTLLTPAVGNLPAQILRHTNRDGVPLFRVDGAINTFDEAYKRNWMEYGLALWKVVAVNGFVPIPAGVAKVAAKATE